MSHPFACIFIQYKRGILLYRFISREKKLFYRSLRGGLGELRERGAFWQGEWPAARAYQAAQVRAAVELFAEVVGQGANVGSFAAFDGKGEDRGLRRLPVDDLKLVDGDGARFHGDFFASPGAFVGGLPLQFDGGVTRRYLHLLAEKLGQDCFDAGKRQFLRTGRANDRSLSVVGIRNRAKNNA